MQPVMKDPMYRRTRHRHGTLRWINRVVLAVGYAFIAYELVRGIVYLLVLWEEAS